jgi:hypothetical protein
MFSKALVYSAGLALSLGLVAAAQASTLPLGGTSYAVTTAAGTTNTTDIDFSLAAGSVITGINDLSNPGTSLTSMSFVLGKWNGSSYTWVGTTSTNLTLPGGTLLSFENYLPYQTGVGKYQLAVTETAGGFQGSSGGNITVNAVPIPGSLLLLGSALFGLGGISLRKSRRTTAA